MRRNGRDVAVVLLIAAGVVFSTCVHAIVRQRSARDGYMTDDIVRIWIPAHDRPAATMQSDELQVLRDSGLVGAVAAYVPSEAEIEVDGMTWQSPIAVVNPAFWSVFELDAIRGRLFEVGDSISSDIAVISGDVWRTRFGRSPSIVGTAIRVAGQPVTIVGVAPEGFAYPGKRTSIWMLLPVSPPAGTSLQHPVVARLPAGTSMESLRSVLPVRLRSHGTPVAEVRLQPVHDFELEGVQPYFTLLQFLATLSMALAFVNVMCLLSLSRIDRARATALKAALGAAPMTILAEECRRLVTRAVAAGCVSVAGTYLTLHARDALQIGPTAGTSTGTDVQALTSALVAAISVAGVAYGVSALVALRQVRHAWPRQSVRQPWSRRAQSSVLFLQFLVPFAIVPVALMQSASLIAVASDGRHLLDPELVAMKVKLPSDRYATNRSQVAVVAALFERLSAAGLRDAAITNALPLRGSRTLRTVKAHARPYTEDAMSMVDLRIVSPSLLSVLGTRLRTGRVLHENDVAGTIPSVVVDSLLAEQVFEGDVAPGSRITLGQRPWDIVGIVDPVRESLTAELQPTIWISYRQLEHLQLSDDYLTTLWLIFRREDERTQTVVKTALQAVAPGASSGDASSLAFLAYSGIADRVGYASTAVVTAVLVLLLSLAGVFAIAAARVRLMQRELATRIAIGATTKHLVWTCIRDVAFMLPLAACGGWLVNRALVAVMPAATIGDTLPAPAAMLLAAGIVAAGVVAAMWKPVRLGSGVSPLIALRADD